MIYCFDLDRTLCSNTYGKYENASPLFNRISRVSELFESGNYIIIDTAGGSTTGIVWYDYTEKQLNAWGLKYTQLRVGVKLHFDILIDDKGINDKLFFTDENK